MPSDTNASGFISDKNKSEKVAGISEEKMAYARSLLGDLLEGCQIISPDWCYLYFNNAAIRHGKRRNLWAEQWRRRIRESG